MTSIARLSIKGLNPNGAPGRSVFAGQQLRGGIRLDRLEVSPAVEAAGAEQVFQPREVVFLEGLPARIPSGTVAQRRLEASTDSGASGPMASRTAAISAAP